MWKCLQRFISRYSLDDYNYMPTAHEHYNLFSNIMENQINICFFIIFILKKNIIETTHACLTCFSRQLFVRHTWKNHLDLIDEMERDVRQSPHNQHCFVERYSYINKDSHILTRYNLKVLFYKKFDQTRLNFIPRSFSM